MALKVGDTAPDFELPAVEGDQRLTVKLGDFRGKKNVVVAFHPLDWTPTCGEQLPAFDLDLAKFAALDAQVLDISTDSVFSHMAWQKHSIGTMHFPICSDLYPHGEVAKAFGIFRDGPALPGISERAVFIVDKSGKIVFAKVYRLDERPDNAELLKVLESLR
jgi:peroxiredoxin